MGSLISPRDASKDFSSAFVERHKESSSAAAQACSLSGGKVGERHVTGSFIGPMRDNAGVRFRWSHNPKSRECKLCLRAQLVCDAVVT